MKIVLLDKKCEPFKAHPQDAGFDLKARISETIYMHPNMRVTIPTGICIAVPKGYVGDIRPRSGIVKDRGLVAQYGTVDSGYTGEVKVTIINLSTKHQTIEPYERIAQLVVLPIATFELEYVDKLDETERGNNGFGSTGKFNNIANKKAFDILKKSIKKEK